MLAAASSSVRYLVNAGKLAADSWYLNEDAEGSRFAGEGGHFIDTLAWWLDALPEEVYAVRGTEKGDLQATFRFRGGAAGTIAYLTGGNNRFPKETMDVTGSGRSALLDNFRTATVWSNRGKAATKARGGQDKGQRAEMEQFVEAVRTGGPMPIGIDSLHRHHPSDDRGRREPGQRPAGARVMPPGSAQKLTWYARRLSRMSPGEIAWRVREQARAGPGRASRCGRARWPRCPRCPWRGGRRLHLGASGGHRLGRPRAGQGGHRVGTRTGSWPASGRCSAWSAAT